MGRNNADFNGSALYHGSPKAISVGDVITPGHTGKAYATPHIRTAHFMAEEKLRETGAADPIDQHEVHVYRVEPVSAKEKLSSQPVVFTPLANGEHAMSPEITSSKGFRVVSEVPNTRDYVTRLIRANSRGRSRKIMGEFYTFDKGVGG